MEVLYARCGGLDVHQRFVVACLSGIEAGQRRQEIRTFRCVTADLLAVRRWLADEGCTHVVLESTGVYWRPVYDRLTGSCEVLVANAQHIKKVPGRKTDVQDAEWLADLRHAWEAFTQFCPRSGATRPARSHPFTPTPGAEPRPTGQSPPQNPRRLCGIKLTSVRSLVLGVRGARYPARALRGRT